MPVVSPSCDNQTLPKVPWVEGSKMVLFESQWIRPLPHCSVWWILSLCLLWAFKCFYSRSEKCDVKPQRGCSVPTHVVGMKRWKSAGKGMQQPKIPYTAGRSIIGTNTLENYLSTQAECMLALWQVLWKTIWVSTQAERMLALWPNVSTQAECKQQKCSPCSPKTETRIFVAALFIISSR